MAYTLKLSVSLKKISVVTTGRVHGLPEANLVVKVGELVLTSDDGSGTRCECVAV